MSSTMPPLEARRVAEVDLALDARLDGAREDLAVGEVLLAAARDPRPPSTPTVRSVPFETTRSSLFAPSQSARRAQVVAEALATPPTGSSAVEPAGAVDEPLVLGERHLGVLRRGVRREERDRPAKLAGRSPLEIAVAERLARSARTREPRGIDVREPSRVRVGLEHDPDVGALVVLRPRRVHPVELGVCASLQQELGRRRPT